MVNPNKVLRLLSRTDRCLGRDNGGLPILFLESHNILRFRRCLLLDVLRRGTEGITRFASRLNESPNNMHCVSLARANSLILSRNPRCYLLTTCRAFHPSTHTGSNLTLGMTRLTTRVQHLHTSGYNVLLQTLLYTVSRTRCMGRNIETPHHPLLITFPACSVSSRDGPCASTPPAGDVAVLRDVRRCSNTLPDVDVPSFP